MSVRALRLLLVEDNAADAELMLRTLQAAEWSVTSRRVDTATAFDAALSGEEWDLVLCDYRLPSFDPFEALAAIRQRGLDLPLIVISGTVGEELAADLMRAGARDLVLKGKLARLAPAIEREVDDAAQRKEKRRIESSLHALQARLQSLAESSFVGIATGRHDGLIVEANDAFLRILGRERAALTAQTIRWDQYIAPEDLPVAAAARDRMLAGQQAEPFEARIVRPDGARLWCLVGLTPFEDGEGALVVMLDITEHKKLQEQYHHAQKMESVGRLAGGIAHDFNNLLTVIGGYAEMLQADPGLPVRDRRRVEEIVAAAQRAAGLTRQLLAFSRKGVIQRRVIDLGQLLRDLRRMLHRLIGEDVELTLEIPPTLHAIYADAGQIDQIVMNLAVNARDAMPRGGRLHIAARNLDAGAVQAPSGLDSVPFAWVELSVGDTGTGMDAATQQRIFEPFFTTKGVGKGTGLGLATVYGIVKSFGGWIDVTSELGVGTTFRIYLPAREAPAATQPVATTARAPGGHETILLVEDDAAVRGVIMAQLDHQGYKVIDHSDGRKALEALAQNPTGIALLVSDVVMPGMSGVDLANAARVLVPNLKVLHISGYTDRAILDEVNRYGGVLLQKPFTAAALLEQVRELLDR